jgi:hypothetical protein
MDNDVSWDIRNPARSPSKGYSRQRRVSGALRREMRGHQVNAVDFKRRGEGNPGEGCARRCVKSPSSRAGDSQVPGEFCFTVGGVRDNRQGRQSYGLSRFIETSDGKLEHPLAAEPCRSRANLALEGARHALRRTSEGIDERGYEVFFHITEKSESDVPPSRPDQPHTLSRPQFQQGQTLQCRIIGPYRHEHSHIKSA